MNYKTEIVHSGKRGEIHKIMIQIDKTAPEDFPIHIQIGDDGFGIKDKDYAKVFNLGVLAVLCAIDREGDTEDGHEEVSP